MFGKKAGQMFGRPTWAEIDLDAIRHNVREVKRTLPETTELMAVVKANGYGHGAGPVAKAALSAGATQLAVASVDEAIELRQEGIEAPILVLGYTDPAHAHEVVAWKLTQTVYELRLATALNRAAEQAQTTAKVHLKVDTGMGRIGVRGVEETVALLKQLREVPAIFVEGIFTHLATADEADRSYAEEQIAQWEKICRALEGIKYRHLSNSAAILHHPSGSTEPLGNMVRLGISLYGYYPSKDVPKKVPLRPALRFVSQIVHLKVVPAGTKISYGATYVTTGERTWIATVPVGYADGYSRLLSGKGQALVRGVRVPVVGRVCMDQLMLDVSAVPDAQVGDEVVLYGRQGEETISLEEVAERIGTITYEVCCDLGRRVPRVYFEDGKQVFVRKD
jgi:alanine racemase